MTKAEFIQGKVKKITEQELGKPLVPVVDYDGDTIELLYPNGFLEKVGISAEELEDLLSPYFTEPVEVREF